jgi:hypothetical protein
VLNKDQLVPKEGAQQQAKDVCKKDFLLLFLGEQSMPVFVQDTETLLQTTHIQK